MWPFSGQGAKGAGEQLWPPPLAICSRPCSSVGAGLGTEPACTRTYSLAVVLCDSSLAGFRDKDPPQRYPELGWASVQHTPHKHHVFPALGAGSWPDYQEGHETASNICPLVDPQAGGCTDDFLKWRVFAHPTCTTVKHNSVVSRVLPSLCDPCCVYFQDIFITPLRCPVPWREPALALTRLPPVLTNGLFWTFHINGIMTPAGWLLSRSTISSRLFHLVASWCTSLF